MVSDILFRSAPLFAWYAGAHLQQPKLLQLLMRFLILGVKSYDVSLDSQTATIVTEPSVSYDTVLATIKKTGKTVNSGEADGLVQSV